MSNLFIALIFTLGATAWIYNKLTRRSGDGNIRPAIIGSAVVGVILFIVSFTLLLFIVKK